jgi:hypothetical protein
MLENDQPTPATLAKITEAAAEANPPNVRIPITEVMYVFSNSPTGK